MQLPEQDKKALLENFVHFNRLPLSISISLALQRIALLTMVTKSKKLGVISGVARFPNSKKNHGLS